MSLVQTMQQMSTRTVFQENIRLPGRITHRHIIVNERNDIWALELLQNVDFFLHDLEDFRSVDIAALQYHFLLLRVRVHHQLDDTEST
jgi:hypothetical protein